MWRIVAGALAGLIAGAVLVFGLALAAIPVFGISQREGAYAMGVVFTLVPAGALAGAVAGGIAGYLRARKRRRMTRSDGSGGRA
jgi:hypothetical protein